MKRYIVAFAVITGLALTACTPGTRSAEITKKCNWTQIEQSGLAGSCRDGNLIYLDGGRIEWDTSTDRVAVYGD